MFHTTPSTFDGVDVSQRHRVDEVLAMVDGLVLTEVALKVFQRHACLPEVASNHQVWQNKLLDALEECPAIPGCDLDQEAFLLWSLLNSTEHPHPFNTMSAVTFLLPELGFIDLDLDTGTSTLTVLGVLDDNFPCQLLRKAHPIR